MNFDFNKTLELIKGGLLNHRETWDAYLGENPAWQQTLITLTGPLLITSVLLSHILSRMTGNISIFSMGGNWFMALLTGLVMAALSFAIAAFVFSLLAGVFKGKNNFSRGFAAMSLAAIPAWIAAPIGAAIPWLGGLVTLAGGIMSLVFLYRIIPLALEVPDDKRVPHFIVSLVSIVVINFIIGSVIGASGMRGDVSRYNVGSRDAGRGAVTPSGMFGEIGRQAELMARATDAKFDPPSDGEVSRKQAAWVADSMNKAQATFEEEVAKLKAMSDDIDDKNPSPGDLLKMYKGMGSAISLQNVEMEVVLSADGNWAEYQWVKQQLRNAKLQRGEGSDALEHNFERYKEIQDDLPAGL